MLPGVRKPNPGVRFLGNHAVKSRKPSGDKSTKRNKNGGKSDSMTRIKAHPASESCDEIISDGEDDFLMQAMTTTTTSTPEVNRHTSHISQIDNSRMTTSNTYLSFMSTQERLELRSWGLPDSVLRQYQQMGIETMFHWQAECLANEKVLNGGNLVYSAPTSAGKTLVAEILMLKRVLERKTKAILIYPFVSLAREKMLILKKLLRDTPHRVGGFMGSHHPPGGFKTVDVAVCTIEKANSLVNRMLEEKTLDKLGCVVVDELHLLGDSSRGYLLELLLTKIQFMAKKSGDFHVQIIGMSATLPNLDLLATWLDADLYKTDFRPVPLAEHIKIGGKLLDSSFKLVREIKPEVKINNDPDHLVYLSIETLLEGYSILVFTPTKNWAEKLAETISKEVFILGTPPKPGVVEPPQRTALRDSLRLQLDGGRLSEVLEQLRRCPVGLDSTLEKSIRFGVAYHHAGLTMDERDIIEMSFKQGILRILIATSTLSSGVNLPARRVIIRSPFSFANQLLDTLTYRQMIGRAGRKGIDTQGESILLCKEAERKKVEELVRSDLKPVASCLIQGNGENLCSSMKRAILEVIVSGVANSPDLVEKYASCTLLAANIEQEFSAESSSSRENSINSCVKFLEDSEFIRLQKVENASGESLRYVATQLGLACLGSSLSPDEGLTVLRELEKARKCFVLENDLHIIYQVVPVYLSANWPNMDWMNYLSIWESLSSDMKRVGELVGVDDRFIFRGMRGTLNPSLPTQSGPIAIHNRFYTALALHDLVNEVPMMTVAAKYGASKGMLQSLQQASSSYAGMVTVFCAKLGWHSLELLIGQFQDRLQFGVHRELIDLCRLTSLNGQRARIIFNAGIESVAQLANTSPADLENILANSVPFERGKQGAHESANEALRRKRMRAFFVTGKAGLTESDAAVLIIEEAREILQSDLGIQVNWEDKNSVSVLQASLLSTSKASKSTHQSYLTNYKTKGRGAKPKPRKKRTQNRTANRGSNPHPTNKSIPSVSHISNKSFDVTAQFEEIFEIEMKQVQRPCSPDIRPDVRDRDALNQMATTNHTDEEQIAIPTVTFDPISPIEPNQSVQTSPTVTNQLVKDCFKTPTLKSALPGPKSRSDPKRRVSWNDAQVIGNKISPPKKACIEIHQQAEKANESFDVFGDSFADMDLTNMSFEGGSKPSTSKLSKSVDQKNKSCPKTPIYDVCSEELILEETKGGLSADQLVDVLHESTFSKDDTISDSFLERAIETHLSADMDESKNEEIVEKQNFDQQNTEQSKEEKSSPENSDFLFQTPSILRELPSSSKKRQRSELIKSNFLSPGVTTPSPKRSQRLMHRRQHQKALLKQHTKISPGLVLSSDSENDCNSPNLKTIGSSQEELNIIDVCTNRTLFEHFDQEWEKQESFAIALGCSKSSLPVSPPKNSCVIGLKTMKKKKNPTPIVDPGFSSTEFDVSVVGLAVSWDKLNAYFIALSDSKLDPDDSIAPPSQDASITMSERIIMIRKNLEVKSKWRKCIYAFDMKHLYKVLYMTTGILLDKESQIPKLMDPKVAAWMLQPNDNEKNLHNMVMSFTPQLSGVLSTLGSSTGCGSVAMNPSGGRNSAPRARAVAEAVLTRNLVTKLVQELKAADLFTSYKEIEMPSIITLAKMELNGFGFSEDECEKQRKIIYARLDELQDEAYKLAGRQFSLTSPADICQVLYRELRLPLNGEKSNLGQRAPVINSAKSKGLNAPSSKKDILIKLTEFHKLPMVLLEWKKLNSTVTKVIGPFCRQKVLHPVLKMDRIYSYCQTFTSTGRVALHEPNIQNIPKDFDIIVTPELLKKALGEDANQTLNNSSIFMSSFSSLIVENHNPNNYSVSLRRAFVPWSGCLMIGADYSQLELRIMAHLSNDSQLCHLLSQSGSDVFKNIAATWKRKPVDQVTEKERNDSKQICYGMLYGIGVKALSEQLCVIEEEASAFMSSFKSAYPGVKKFIDDTVTQCRKQGYVVTIGGRRRYLPNINLTDGCYQRAAAERQAINSTVQGSAADLVKKAMIDIDRRLGESFPASKKPIRYRKSDTTPYVHSGAFLLLQLHDELIYEVVQEDVVQVAEIIRSGMENAVALKVPTPVRIKIGTSWGELQDMKN